MHTADDLGFWIVLLGELPKAPEVCGLEASEVLKPNSYGNLYNWRISVLRENSPRSFQLLPPMRQVAFIKFTSCTGKEGVLQAAKVDRGLP